MVKFKNALAFFFTLVVVIGASGCIFIKKPDNNDKSIKLLAKQITSADELIGGPNALGGIGDYLMENDKIRIIIQGPGYSRGMNFYGGGIIDADIRRNGPGKDNFGEMMPVFFLMGMQPNSMEVLDDGRTGKAHIRVTGEPGPVIMMITKFYPFMVGDDQLSQIAFQRDYYLEMGKPYVEIHTSIINKDSKYELNFGLDSFITLAKSMLKMDINLDVPMPVGEVLLFGAGNYVFAPGETGYDLQYTLEKKLYFEPLRLPALPGLATEFMATSGPDVSYGFFVAPHEQNFAYLNRDYYANATDHSLEIPFLMDGMTGAYHTIIPKAIAGGKSFTTVQYFAVGDGDVGSIRDIYHEFFNDETGTMEGQVIEAESGEALANMSVVVFDANKQPFSQYFTDENGEFSGQVPPGRYYLRVVAEDRFSTTMEEAVSIDVRAGKSSFEIVTIGESGTLVALVSDENGHPVPAKVVVMGQIPAEHHDDDPWYFLYDYSINERLRPNDLSWTIKDGYGNHEYIEKIFNTADGSLEQTVRPGKYTVVISRGPEYSQFRQEVEIKAGESIAISATLRHVVNTPEYSAGDVHIHSVNSLDSFTLLPDRVTAIAAEGLDFAVASDHNIITNYEDDVKKLNLEKEFKPLVGMEYTTFEMGHFNAFPLRYDADKPVHGVSPYVPAPGEDATAAEKAAYEELPSYMRKPQRPASFGDPTGFEWLLLNPTELMDELRSLGKYSPEETVVVVNHPRDTFMGYFNAFNLDTNTGMPRPSNGVSGLLMDRTAELLGSGELNNGVFKCSGFSFDFDAIEVLNGQRMDLLHSVKMPLDATSEELAGMDLPDGNGPGKVLVDENGQHAYPGGVNDWFNLLNQGYKYAVVGASDSHRIIEDQVGLNRTYMRVGEKLVSALDEKELIRAIKERRTIVSNGPFATLKIDTDAKGNDNGEIGQVGEQITALNGQVRALVSLQSVDWIKVDRLVLWVNGVEVKEWTHADGLPGTLKDGSYSFEAEEVISLDKDSWVVLEALGDDEGRNSLWPVYIYRENPMTNIANVANELIDSLGVNMDTWGRFKPSYIQRAYPYALTSPIWIDVDGDGSFSAPEEKATPCAAWK